MIIIIIIMIIIIKIIIIIMKILLLLLLIIIMVIIIIIIKMMIIIIIIMIIMMMMIILLLLLLIMIINFDIAPFTFILFKKRFTKNSQWTDVYGPYSQINSFLNSNVFSCVLKDMVNKQDLPGNVDQDLSK